MGIFAIFFTIGVSALVYQWWNRVDTGEAPEAEPEAPPDPDLPYDRSHTAKPKRAAKGTGAGKAGTAKGTGAGKANTAKGTGAGKAGTAKGTGAGKANTAKGTGAGKAGTAKGTGTGGPSPQRAKSPRDSTAQRKGSAK